MSVEVKDEAILQRLRKENQEFQRWEQEHRQLEETLLSIDAHPYISPEEEMERKRVQKLKLAAKDRMMEMVRRSQFGSA